MVVDSAASQAEPKLIDQLLPLFIDAAGGDKALARAMIHDKIKSYEPKSLPDLLRVVRIIGLRMSAVSNLRLSMDISQDAQACWQQAASLSKEADRIVETRSVGRAAWPVQPIAAR